MEIAKDKMNLGINYNTGKRLFRTNRRRVFFNNKALFICIVILTFLFSIINIMLIVDFFRILANF